MALDLVKLIPSPPIASTCSLSVASVDHHGIGILDSLVHTEPPSLLLVDMRRSSIELENTLLSLLDHMLSCEKMTRLQVILIIVNQLSSFPFLQGLDSLAQVLVLHRNS